MSRFSETLLEHARYPSNRGLLDDAQYVGRASLNGNPPFITIHISVSNSIVDRAAFEASGCGVTTAICSATTELLFGRTLEECKQLTEEEICDELDGVPPDKRHCIHITLKALSLALGS